MTSTRGTLVACTLTAALLLSSLPALGSLPLASLVLSAAPLGRIDPAEAAPISPSCSRTAVLNPAMSGLTLPSSGAPSSASLALVGSGFLSFEPLTVYFNAAVPLGGSDQGSNAMSTAADVNGNLAVTLPLTPRPVANAQYAVTAVGMGGSCATFDTLPIGNVPSIEGTSGTLSPDVLTVSASAQTILLTSTIVPSNVVSLQATIDSASTNNYSSAAQVTPMPIGAFPRQDLSTATQSVFQVVVPGALTPNVHSIILTGMAPGTATAFRDAAGLRYRAAAPPLLSTSPASGPPFSAFTVSGFGFAGSSPASAQPVTVTLTAAGGSTPIFTATATSSISGAFTTPITVPAGAAAGTASLRAVDAAGTQATGSFAVTPLTSTNGSASLTVVPSGAPCLPPAGVAASVVPTEPVVVVLGGYMPNETVSVVVNGLQFAGIKVDGNGNANVSVPFPVANRDMTPAGALPGDRGVAAATYMVSAVGSASGKVATQSIATCATSLMAANPAIVAGSAQPISGTGFAAGEVVTVTSYPSSQAAGLTGPSASGVAFAFTTTTNLLGQFGGIYTTPITYTGYTLRAQGATSNLVATTAITPTASGLTVSGGAVYPCSPFALSATSGFTPADVLSLTPQGGAPVMATATAAGGFAVTLTVPANAPAGLLPVTVASSRGNLVVAQPITVPAALLTVAPVTIGQGATTTVSGAGYIPSSAVTIATEFIANGVAVPAGGPTQVVTTSATGTFSATVTVSPTIAVIGGSYQLRGTSTCSTQNTTTVPITISSNAPPSPTTTPLPAIQPTMAYFAEGYTGRALTNGRADFDEYLSVLNVESFTKSVTFTYEIQGQTAPLVKVVTVGANADLLESVNGDVGGDKIVSAIVSSNYRVGVERVINRTAPGGRLDADSSSGSTAPGTTWYFAEGYTGATFQEYLTVQNPSLTAARVTVTFLPQNVPATTPRTVVFSVPANGRATENIRRDYLAYGQQSVGMIVSSDTPIVTERVLYFGDGAGSAKFGATAAPGLTNPGQQFFFAYGSRPGAVIANVTSAAQMANDESYVTVVNPGVLTATVQVTFFDASGRRLGVQALTVAPRTRRTAIVNSILAPLSGPFSTRVTSDQPILVEKPQYFGGSPNIGRHPGVSPSGSLGGAQSLLFPNVDTALANGLPMSETVFLLNIGASTITITGTYYTPAGQTASVPYSVAAGQIVAVDVNAGTRGLPAGPLGAQFVSLEGSFVATRIANTPDHLSFIGSQGIRTP